MNAKIVAMTYKKRSSIQYFFLAGIFLFTIFIILRSDFKIVEQSESPASQTNDQYREITGTIAKGETLSDIFKRYKLDFNELLAIKDATADVHTVRKLVPGNLYKIFVDDKNQVNSLVYWINDDNMLNIDRTETGYSASKIPVEYEKKIHYLGGTIKDNLVSSIGDDSNSLILALMLSDIFAWDIDFTSDLRNGDMFKIVVEGLYLDGTFKKYGNIFATEFVNNSMMHQAYRFEIDGRVDYFDRDGKSLRRSFLKAPLNFRRISSGFSKRRFHPVLRIYRPHLGVDYAAATGTPVSTVGDGTVLSSGYKGQNGKQVIIRHPNGYKTYYGHLSKIKRGIRSGVKVKQGDIIGYVGSTGLSTGPHLDYRVKKGSRFVNPLKLNLPRGEPVPKAHFIKFTSFQRDMDGRLASITSPAFASSEKIEDKT
jgi:murein DD-endopeptidase MepM/ murein hydrolase activator NlpD